MNRVPLATPANPRSTNGDAAGGARDEQYRWDLLVPRALNPIQVAIIEALHRLGCPLSPSELRQVIGTSYTVSRIGYHVTALAKLDALELVAEEPVRGTVRHLYALKELGPP